MLRVESLGLFRSLGSRDVILHPLSLCRVRGVGPGFVTNRNRSKTRRILIMRAPRMKFPPFAIVLICVCHACRILSVLSRILMVLLVGRHEEFYGQIDDVQPQ